MPNCCQWTGRTSWSWWLQENYPSFWKESVEYTPWFSEEKPASHHNMHVTGWSRETLASWILTNYVQKENLVAWSDTRCSSVLCQKKRPKGNDLIDAHVHPPCPAFPTLIVHRNSGVAQRAPGLSQLSLNPKQTLYISPCITQTPTVSTYIPAGLPWVWTCVCGFQVSTFLNGPRYLRSGFQLVYGSPHTGRKYI